MLTLVNQELEIKLHLEIIGYQFPSDPYDNWCLLSVNLKCGKHVFKAVDPALETSDIQLIYDWFYSLSQSSLPRYSTLNFTEPCIGFEFLKYSMDALSIGVSLTHELKPNFCNVEQEDSMLIFELRQQGFSQILHNIQATINKFPVRKDYK